MNLICPTTYNAADYYINCLAVTPGHEKRSRDNIKNICDRFSVSSYAKDLDIATQYQEAVSLVRSQALQVGCSLRCKRGALCTFRVA